MAATDAVVALRQAPERPTIELAATIGRGDSFMRVMQRAGVGGGDAQSVANLVSSVVPLDAIRDGTRIDITLGRRFARNQPRPVELIAFRARFDLNVEIIRAGSELDLVQKPILVDATPLAHSRHRRLQPVPLRPRSRRTAARDPGVSADAGRSAFHRQRHPLDRPVRHHRRLQARRHRRSRDGRVAVCGPRTQRQAARADAALAGRQLQPVVRGIGRRRRTRRVRPPRQRRGDLRLRLSPPPDPALSPHAQRPRFPRAQRHADLRHRRWRGELRRAARAATAISCASPTAATSPADTAI